MDGLRNPAFPRRGRGGAFTRVVTDQFRIKPGANRDAKSTPPASPWKVEVPSAGVLSCFDGLQPLVWPLALRSGVTNDRSCLIVDVVIALIPPDPPYLQYWLISDQQDSSIDISNVDLYNGTNKLPLLRDNNNL